MRRVIRASVAGLGVVAVVLMGALGVTLRAASVLLAFVPAHDAAATAPPTSFAGSAARYASPGPYPVGLRRWTAAEAPLPLTVWYPALLTPDAPSSLRYSYGAAMLDAGTTVALATAPGRAVPGAGPDPSGGPYPVVVLSSGFAIGAGSYAWLAEHLASHGFVVAAPQHAESLDPQTLWQATIDRPRDVSTALDLIEHASAPGGRIAGLADLGRVAVVGHSYGGYTALAAAGARLDTTALKSACRTDGAPGQVLAFQCDALVPHLDDLAARAGLDAVPAGKWPSWADPRIDAAVALAGDAVMFGSPGLAHLSVPLLTVGGTADADSPFAWGTALAYENSSSPRKAELSLAGAEHFVFTGGCDAPRTVLVLVRSTFCDDPAWHPGAAHDVIAPHVTAFLLAQIAGDREARAALAPSAQAPASRVGYRAVGY
jgi:predicted dienelactone hydrolase